MNELMPFQESVLNKDEKTFLESKTIMVEDPKMVAAWKCLDNSTKEIMWKHLQVLYCLGHQYLQQKNYYGKRFIDLAKQTKVLCKNKICIFNGKTIEIKKIQIIKLDQMINVLQCYVVDNCSFLYLGAI